MCGLVGGGQEQGGWRLVVAFVGGVVECVGGGGDGELDGKDGGPWGIGGAGDGVTEEEEAEVEDKDDAGGIGEGRECGAGGTVEAEMEEDNDDEARENGDVVIEGDDVDATADDHDVLEAAPPGPCPEMGCMGMCRRSARVSGAKPKMETDEGDVLSEREGG